MYFHSVLLLTLFSRIVQCEVVDSYFTRCKSFFYKGSPPRGFYLQRISSICQRYKNKYHFATLYSSRDRIPIYSAYRLDAFNCTRRQPNRRNTWFIEPQLSGIGSSVMTTEGTQSSRYKTNQSINVDYKNTNFDRGHLNPNSYQCDEGRTATFTLTNAVPQDPCFNQQMWKDMEARSKNIMRGMCNFAGAEKYFITGAVPSNNKIPSAIQDEEGDETREYERVSIPSGMWTAACCDSSGALHDKDKNKGFSFAYYGENVPDSYVEPYTVKGLEETLVANNDSLDTLDIFADSCFSASEKSKQALQKLSIPVEQKIARKVYNMAKSSQSSLLLAKRSIIQKVNANLQNNDDIANKNWQFADVEFSIKDTRSHLQNTRELLASLGMAPILVSTKSHRAAKREVDIVTDEKSDEYTIVPSMDKALSATGSRCRQDHHCDYHSKYYKWCYTDWGTSWDYCCNDKCGFEGGTNYAWCYIRPRKVWLPNFLFKDRAHCSQRSSMLSVIGRQCRADHECGTHGNSYHWCYTDTSNNWEYCCQPWHECDYHEKGYKWCYAGYKKETKWKYCYY